MSVQYFVIDSKFLVSDQVRFGYCISTFGLKFKDYSFWTETAVQLYVTSLTVVKIYLTIVIVEGGGQIEPWDAKNKSKVPVLSLYHSFN